MSTKRPAPAYTPELSAAINSIAPQLLQCVMTRRAEVGAELWRDLLASNPNLETLRLIAFEWTLDEAFNCVCEIVPAAKFFPGVREFISDLQHEMRRPR